METLLSAEDTNDALQNNVDDLDQKYANHFNGDELLQENAMLRRRSRSEINKAGDAKAREVCRQNVLKFSVHGLLTWIIKTGAREAFGNVVIVLQLVLTIAISERSLTKLKLLKTQPRSTMSHNMPRGLSIISIEKNLVRTLDYHEIIKTFAQKKARQVPM